MHEMYQRFVIMSIIPPDKPISRHMKFLKITISTIFLIGLFTTLYGSFFYTLKYISTEMANAICAIFQICGLILAIYSIFMAYIKRHDIKATFDDFQIFCEASK